MITPDFKDRLIVFGRYPEPGRTKTRLISVLGAVGAADLQRRLTEKTLRTARAFGKKQGVEVEFCFEGCDEGRVRQWLGPGIILSRQVGGDIGERMHAAFLRSFKSGCRRVVLMGTDIPEVNAEHLRKSFHALTSRDLVLGPSRDGGYWLMGLKAPADLFQNIEWGSGRVIEQTLAAAEAGNLRIYPLDPLNDIDTQEDLREGMPEWRWTGPYVSVIIPALNEEKNIVATVGAARNPDAEIIVVDGGSGDDTAACAADAGARVEHGPRGRALQQNFGAKKAGGNVLLFLHSDTRLPEDYINHIFDTLLVPGTAAGAFRFKTDLNSPLMRVIEWVANIRSGLLQLPYGDQALFVRKSLFERAGGFPEVSIAEDLFFVRRLSKYGRIRTAPATAVTSARRWLDLGPLRTTIINQVIVAGIILGISPRTLASLYRRA
ncbi:MAG: TIGR04283 family arsenosugar biosynthesis glycosyltransferase [Pseudomonadota bacterium]